MFHSAADASWELQCQLGVASCYTGETLAPPLGFVLFSNEVFLLSTPGCSLQINSGYSLFVVWKRCTKSPSPASPVQGVSEIGAQVRDVPGSLRESLLSSHAPEFIPSSKRPPFLYLRAERLTFSRMKKKRKIKENLDGIALEPWDVDDLCA